MGNQSNASRRVVGDGITIMSQETLHGTVISAIPQGERPQEDGSKPFVSVSWSAADDEFTVTCRGTYAAYRTMHNTSNTSEVTRYLDEKTFVFETPGSTQTLWILAIGDHLDPPDFGWYWGNPLLVAADSDTADRYSGMINVAMQVEKIILNSDGTHSFSGGGGPLIPGVGYKPAMPVELTIGAPQNVSRLYYSPSTKTLVLGSCVFPRIRLPGVVGSPDDWRRNSLSINIPVSTNSDVYVGLDDYASGGEAILQLNTTSLYGYRKIGNIRTNSDGKLVELEDYTQEMAFFPMGLNGSVTYITGINFGAQTFSTRTASFINGVLVDIT